MHYSITLRCLLMIALFIYFLFAGSSYFELLQQQLPLFWCRAIFNNPDLLRWAGVMEIRPLYWAPVAASVLTGLFKNGKPVAELWDVDVPITRSSATHAEKEKHGVSLCGQRMSKSKFAAGQQSMLLQQAWAECARVPSSGGFVPLRRCWVKWGLVNSWTHHRVKLLKP